MHAASNSAAFPQPDTPANGLHLATHAIPFNLGTDEATLIIGSPTIFKRLRFSGWIEPLEPSASGRRSLYPYSRLLAAQERMLRGEMPPLLPCEIKEKERRRRRDIQKASSHERELQPADGIAIGTTFDP